MKHKTILNVAVNVPLARLFDYLPPAGGNVPAPGTRVLVPFGRRQQVGLVMAHAADSDLERSRLKRVEAVLDDEPLLSDDALWLIRFTSDYYHHPVGEVAAAMLPVLLRKGNALYPVLEFIAPTNAGVNHDINALTKRAPRQAELLLLLCHADGNGIDADSLTKLLPNWRRAAKPLFDKALIARFENRADDRAPSSSTPQPGPTLNRRQEQAVKSVRGATGFGAFLLDGVTGSGKTEVYLRLIEDALNANKQTLVLVPEIGLTPQMISRFRERLGIEPTLMHSALSDVERLTAWRRARAGEARLIVGTRSAVFAPLPNPALIIVDEEHDHSFKQQEGLRYSARDLAIARASRASVPIVLGSATPTLELLQHCKTGTYTHLSLPERAGKASRDTNTHSRSAPPPSRTRARSTAPASIPGPKR